MPYYKIGQIYYNQKDYEESLLWYFKALDLDKNNNTVNYYIGKVYKDTDMPEKAAEYFKISAYCGNDNALKELREIK